MTRLQGLLLFVVVILSETKDLRFQRYSWKMNAAIHCRFAPQNKKMRILGILLILLHLGCAASFAEDFQRALPGRSFSFPQDHFSHPDFKTEWWYYSGHLQPRDQVKRPFGFQLTFFRTGLKRETKDQRSKWLIQSLYFAHLALTDESKKTFDYREKVHRGSLGEAGATPYTVHEKTFRVWIEDWLVEGRGPGLKDHFLKAGDRDLGIELILTPEKNPVVHGENGISQKSEGNGYGSHYYSITRLKTEGKIFQKNKEIPVQGIGWMDHEFGSSQLREDQAGWDWFSIQLENRSELMFYQIRHKDGKFDPYSSGTIIFPDGTCQHLTLKEFQIEALDHWKGAKSGATYPSGWKISVPHQKIELTLVPAVKDQELVTRQSTRVTYWEGSVKVDGKCGNDPVKGEGYAELTGYAKPLSGKM
jgi:predicted secreted hydrolase